MVKSSHSTDYASSDAAGARSRIISALTEMGFSQYEARTYTGLIGRPAMTGYAVAKETQVPQPKVYETLGRLAERGAVLQVADKPARFIAVPPARLLRQMESDFRKRMSSVELEMTRFQASASNTQALRPFREASSWVDIAAAAVELINNCKERLYISGHSEYLDALSEAVVGADSRNVHIDVMCFGQPPFSLRNGSVVRHTSTDRIVYRHHQARHLAVTADRESSLWALAANGNGWEAIWADDDGLLTALVKGFIRHDLFVQRVFEELEPEIIGRFGRGLEGLFTSRNPGEAASPESDVARLA